MKSSMRIFFTLSACLVFSLGCSTALWAAENGQGDQIKLPRLRLSAPVEETPYTGYGQIVILDDATLIVILRETVTKDDGDESAPGEVLDRVGYDLDTTGLSLVEYGDQVFLDRNGMQLQRRGLTADQVSTVSFDGAGRAPSTDGNDILDNFSGEINLRSDRLSGSLFISVLDDETKRLFTVTLGASRAVGTGSASRGGGGTPVPTSQCSITECRGGDGSITCVGKGCKCICLAGDPTCTCTVKASVG